MICKIHGHQTGEECPRCVMNVSSIRDSLAAIKPVQVVFKINEPASVDSYGILAQMWDKMVVDDLDKCILEIGGIIITMDKRKTLTPPTK